MPVNDELGKRMKEYYEQIPKSRLMRRTPVAIRLDGKAFHTFTRGFQKPFDKILMETMQLTMKYLCENIQGCVFGYTQSDEITLILVDYKKLNSDAWFDYEVQKMCSISASMATLAFNRYFEQEIRCNYDVEYTMEFGGPDEELIKTYCKALDKGAMFDARVFNIPKEEVCNLIYWRQLDAARNSIQMVGQTNFSHNVLQGKNCSDIQDMLMLEKGINWNNFPIDCKRGAACIKKIGMNPNYFLGDIQKGIMKTSWVIDKEMPMLKGEDRNYVELLLLPEEK